MLLSKFIIEPKQAFVGRARQILDAVVIVNQTIDSLRRRGECGILCKLDIEKAYGHIT